MKTEYYLKKIKSERERQDQKWVQQDHHPLLWFSIIAEEFGEMCKAFNKFTDEIQDGESNDFNHFKDMQHEAIQVAASCIAMLECIDRMAERDYTP